MNIRQLLEALASSKLEYSCINGYHNIFESGNCHLHFLVSNRKAFVTLLRLTPVVSPDKIKVAYTNEENPAYNFYVYQKGEGLFNERLESKILSSSVMDANQLIKRPDYQSQLQICIYRLLVYRDIALTVEERRIMKQYVSQTIGEPPKCKINHSYFASTATSS